MKEILFGSFNRHKAKECQAILQGIITVRFCQEFPNLVEPEEIGTTFAENALLKARYYHEQTNLPTFADDSGLEIEALNGAPGVHSAYYGGEHGNAEQNIFRVLAEMQGITNRNARFVTVIAFITADGSEHLFEGSVLGTISQEPRGKQGFGYDPIFVPTGETRTFAELNPSEKNQISHRAVAMNLFRNYLCKL
ncbi:MAG: RdgB/HAM1 family non-canonical purine NTP pyrophosphatase [Bacteroidia bacterium]|nr:RdgB/HAM1 family non-canonical purine NTP pyrophosphatase [Bacteroidia bacterium]